VTNWGALAAWQTCRLCTHPALGNAAFLAQQDATTFVYSITTGLSTLLMHGFLIWRYYMLPKTSWKNWLLVPILIGGALTAFIGDMLSTWSVIHFTALADRPKLTHFATYVPGVWPARTVDLPCVTALAFGSVRAFWMLQECKC
jgi:hypothetical protein